MTNLRLLERGRSRGDLWPSSSRLGLLSLEEKWRGRGPALSSGGAVGAQPPANWWSLSWLEHCDYTTQIVETKDSYPYILHTNLRFIIISITYYLNLNMERAYLIIPFRL